MRGKAPYSPLQPVEIRFVAQFRVLVGLHSVWFFLPFRANWPFFGELGVTIGLLGAACLIYLVGLRFFAGASIGTRPLLLAGGMLELTAVQLLTTGILAELLARTYHESSVSDLR